MNEKYNVAPGRGLMSNTAYELRMKYVDTLIPDIHKDLASKTIKIEQIQNNIESFIGTIEIPLGLIGPLLFEDDHQKEWVHTAVATTEGALAASMNRGAKAISECGGFQAHVLHQKMLRTPMFTFDSMKEALSFDLWIKQNFDQIKAITKKYSNYADLIEIKSLIVGKIVHLKFIYTTSDASGQNMTTSCTWHACLWIEEHFQQAVGIEILHFVIDGNGASDKKVSFYSMQNGRGIHVISECFLTNEIIEKTLRTTSDDMFRSFNHSMAVSRMDGMIGYNINVANTVAGIFGATGQDLACIHESSMGILQMEQNKEGLYLSLSLTNLVVGTIGGGTHLPVASRILGLMGCKGVGKVERFAKLIAGFALSLEISTLAAIVSGQFARAHQKLGRNKPVQWLLSSEINKSFLKDAKLDIIGEVENISFVSDSNLDNGILMQLTGRVSKKVIGFLEVDIDISSKDKLPLLIKSKALSSEVIDGLRFMASNLSSHLADTLHRHKEFLEYNECHVKEIEVYKALKSIDFTNIPFFYGATLIPDREIYMLYLERLNTSNMMLFNSENNPEKWHTNLKRKVIQSIHLVHLSFANNSKSNQIPSVKPFFPEKAIELFEAFNQLNRNDYPQPDLKVCFDYLADIIERWKVNVPIKTGELTLVHNDLNPRNVAIRKSEDVCIYDWELATLNIPQRDIFEFLSFTLTSNFETSEFKELLELHFKLVQDYNPSTYNFEQYLADFKIAGEEFLMSRITYYLAGNTLVSYPFIERVFKVATKMLQTS